MQPPRSRREPGNAALPADEKKRMVSADDLTELRGEIVALEVALAATFGEIAALQAAAPRRAAMLRAP